MKLTKLQKRLVDEIDGIMIESSRSFYATKSQREAEFGFALAAPSSVSPGDIKTRYFCRDIAALEAAGLVKVKDNGDIVRIVPEGYYVPNGVL